ncbi:MAG: hypothetical protein LBT89_01610 [Planctomycetaceae bacterium]|jgi:hypothetical protein|nr:hypothetical protein [Planctomycetaceae bacterium]
MLRLRLTIGLAAVIFVLLTSGQSRADFDAQLDQRLQQYRQSMQQRTAALSPELQQKIKTQTEQTIKTGLAKFRSGQLNIRVALPAWKAAQDLSRFLRRHSPFPNTPFGTFGFGIAGTDAVLTVSSFQRYFQTSVLPFSFVKITDADSFIRPLFRNDILTGFVQIAQTVVLRR